MLLLEQKAKALPAFLGGNGTISSRSKAKYTRKVGDFEVKYRDEFAYKISAKASLRLDQGPAHPDQMLNFAF